ncbi:phosphate ABC transporter substrate-binding protein [Anaerofilum sp. BX8]|uniref:Phosphate-binding protein n=1 Tax=Anaerofilum hominis TaxID=2763016 RepID=A0A923I6I8_9FIRM|nr:phosphate ABC transporter substrate-binding protein [Anaerofilum hominis]MBC5581223.1 phosphate ABC transporter substrate-binding protein [Anaerofilum hominis]
MKKIVSLGIVLSLAAALLAGCGGTDSSSGGAASGSAAAPTQAPASALSGSVGTNGSTSMEKVIGSLSEAFMSQNGDVKVTYDPTGSGTGIQAVVDGTTDIGLSSRALKDEEKANGLKETIVALDGIAIIVNKDNPVEDLTLEQIAGLATGAITNWSEVGGSDAEVVMEGREAGSGTRDGFESIVGVSDECKYANESTSTGAVIANVASNPNAIGYASLSAVDDTVKAITVEGVAASEETVLDGSYKIQRPFVFVTKEADALSAEAQAFFDFATGTAANDIITGAGAVPVAK